MTIAILDFGGQYTHLLAQKIRKLGVYSVIHSPEIHTDLLEYKGLILSGGPHSVNEDAAPLYNPDIFNLGIPILGICYGHQLICKYFDSEIQPGVKTEYGSAVITCNDTCQILEGIDQSKVWMSHSDTVLRISNCLQVTAKTENCEIAAIEHTTHKIFGVQFHPEVTHTKYGNTVLRNFLIMCGCSFDWSVKDYLNVLISKLRQRCEHKSVFMLLSGGVDSTVAFTLLNIALTPARVLGLHIDNGFMRYNESKEVTATFKKLHISNFIVIDASEDFHAALIDATDPQQKRQIIGDLFIDIQQRELTKLGLGPDWLLGQGTIYPDTIESGGTKNAKVIKTHHNRVDRINELIELGLVVEPLVDLYKDEVRELGELLGLPHDIVWRHPFPGPGLAIRLLCNDRETTCDLRRVQDRVSKILPKNLSGIVLPIKSVGVQGDVRTYAHPVLLVGDANWDELEGVSTRITNTFPEINRVLYQLASTTKWTVPFLSKVTITNPRIKQLQDVDWLVTQFMKQSGIYSDIWQCPVVLIPCAPCPNTESIVLRPVDSSEAMTASFSRLNIASVRQLARSLLSAEISSISYDITNKPPATIEWE